MTDTALTIQTRDLDSARDPTEILAVAHRAAKALQTVIAHKAHPVIINEEQYLEFEDWQTVGQFYGYTARTTETERVQFGEVWGAHAKAELVDFRTGEVMGGAEAYCMSDEPRWAERPWFQLASMAQTRAAAKALRNRLAWVVVLAGYRPTPAEEMDGIGQQKPQQHEHWCPIHNVAFREFKNNKGERWWSHKDGEAWCKEDTKRQPEPASPPPGKPISGSSEAGPLCKQCQSPIQGEGRYSAAQIIEESTRYLGAPHCFPHLQEGKRRRKALIESWGTIFDRAHVLGLEPAVLGEYWSLPKLEAHIAETINAITAAEEAMPVLQAETVDV